MGDGTEFMWPRIVTNEDGNEPSISTKHEPLLD